MQKGIGSMQLGLPKFVLKEQSQLNSNNKRTRRNGSH
jgi:hypothetical protein